MERNAIHVSDFFNLPGDQVVEIGRQVSETLPARTFVMQPVLLSALRQIFVKLCVAVILAGTVALASNSSLALGLRYFAAVSLLISLALAGMAIFQRNAAQGPLSNWNEATIFSAIAAIAHFFAQRNS